MADSETSYGNRRSSGNSRVERHAERKKKQEQQQSQQPNINQLVEQNNNNNQGGGWFDQIWGQAQENLNTVADKLGVTAPSVNDAISMYNNAQQQQEEAARQEEEQRQAEEAERQRQEAERIKAEQQLANQRRREEAMEAASVESAPDANNEATVQNTPAPVQKQTPRDFSNLVDLSNGEDNVNSAVETQNEQNNTNFFSVGPRYYEQMFDNGMNLVKQNANQQSGIPTQNYAQYVNNSLQRAANASSSNTRDKAEQTETAQDLYDQWKNLLQQEEEPEQTGNGYVPTNLLRAEDFGTSSQPAANGGTNYQWNGQVRQVDNNTGQIRDRVLVDNPNAAQPRDYFSANPEVRRYTPGTAEYAEANQPAHDYFSANPEVRMFTPGTEEYAAAQETGSPYSQSAIDQAIQFMRGELGIFETDPVAEQQYAEQLIADGVFTPFNENERIAPGIQERNAILSTMADQAGNAIGDTLSGLISGVPEGVSERNDILQGMAEQAGNKITGSIENLVSGVKDRNSIIGNINDQAGAALESAGENISSGVDERNMLYGQMLDTALKDLGAGISERNRLVGPVLENVRDRITGGIQQRNDIISSLLSGEAEPNWGNLRPQPSPDALTEEPEILFPADFGGTSANPYDYPNRQNGYVSTSYLRENPEEPVGALYNLIADIYNASNSDGWVTKQASDLYGALPRIDPETPGAEILEQQRRERINSLVRQIAADDELRDEHPQITGKDVERAIDRSQNDTREFTDSLIDFARNVTEPITDMVEAWAQSDNSGYADVAQSAQDAAIAAGLFPGTAAYENFVNNYVRENTPTETNEPQSERQEAGQYAIKDSRNRDSSAYYNSLYDDIRETGVRGSIAENIIENPDEYEYNEDIGRWVRHTPVSNTARSWADQVGSERFMDDLMSMAAPNIDPETGELNTAAQALFLGLGLNEEGRDYSNYYADSRNRQNPDDLNYGLSKEQKLHLFDRLVDFDNPGSGVNSGTTYADLLASDSTHASRNPELTETLKMTADQYRSKFNDFLAANPLIAMMRELGLVTDQDITNNFFNAVELTEGSGSGNGSGSRYYGNYSRRSYGGGGGYSRSYSSGGSSYTPRVSVSTPSLSSSGTARSAGYATRSGSSTYQQPRVNKTPTVKNQQAQRINNIMKNWSF